MSEYFKLPLLRLLGLDSLPAIPVNLGAMVDTLLKLDVRGKQLEQAAQGLSREYTIGGVTARAHSFLFGSQNADAPRAAHRETLRRALTGNPLVIESLVERMKESGEEVFAACRKVQEGVDLTALSLDDPRQWALSWTVLPEVYQNAQGELPSWAATLDVSQPDRATEAFWPTFARYSIALNLILPRKVLKDADLGELKGLFGTAWSDELDEAFGEGRLYVIDLRLFEELDVVEVRGFPRFTPGTVTVLVHQRTADGVNLLPRLVRVAGPQAGARTFVYGKASGAAWLYALQAAKVSVTVWGIWLGHVYHWHIVTAAMQMTMFHHLSPDSRVRRLLDPQSKYVIPFDDVLLVLFGSIAPPTSVKTGFDLLHLLNRFARGRKFFDDDPDVTLEALGLEAKDFTLDEPWDQYPVVQRLLEIWEACGSYVETYVDQVYPTDQSVQSDHELQKWIKASGHKDAGNVQGLPVMDSKAALKRVLRSLVYRVTAHGGGRINSTANPAMSFVANFPPCLQRADIPDPTASFDTQELLSYLPKTGTIGQMMTFLFTFAFSTPYEPFIPIAGIETNLYLQDPEANQALLDLRQVLVDLIEQIQPETPQIWQWPLNIET